MAHIGENEKEVVDIGSNQNELGSSVLLINLKKKKDPNVSWAGKVGPREVHAVCGVGSVTGTQLS